MSERHPMQSSLAEIDRKLRELQRELTTVFDQPEPEADRPAAGYSPAPEPDRPAAGYAPAPEPAPLHAPLRSTAGLSPPPVAPDQARTAGQLAGRVAEVGHQVDDLQRASIALQRAMLELVGDYERLLETSRSVAAGPQTTRPVPVAAGSWPPRDAPARSVFAGDVVVSAGPFAGISAVSAFEAAMARVRSVEDVYVRSFEGDRALLEVRIGEPVDLAEAMRSALPFGFRVTDVGHRLLAIELELRGDDPRPGTQAR